MMRLITFVAFILVSLSTWAQTDIVSELTKKKPGEGTVVLHQDVRLNALLQDGASVVVMNGEERVAKASGFRVQVYAGNNSRQARNEANQMANSVHSKFPELQVYTHFVNPRWLCQVGDFRSIEEADVVMRKLKETGEFKEVSIVRAQINIPY